MPKTLSAWLPQSLPVPHPGCAMMRRDGSCGTCDDSWNTGRPDPPASSHGGRKCGGGAHGGPRYSSCRAFRRCARSETCRPHIEGELPACWLINLHPAEPGVPLPRNSPTGEQSALGGCDAVLADLVRLLWNPHELARANARLDGTRGFEHLVFPGDEGLGDEPGELATSGGRAVVVGAACDQVGALAAHTGRRTELWEISGGGVVKRESAQQLSQLVRGLLVDPELAPVVADEMGADEQQLIPGPCRASHGQYRMSVRRGSCDVQGHGTAYRKLGGCVVSGVCHPL